MLGFLQGLKNRFLNWFKKPEEPEIHSVVPQQFQFSGDQEHIGITAQEVGLIFPGTMLGFDRSPDNNEQHSVPLEVVAEMVDNAIQEIGRVPTRLRDIVTSSAWPHSRIGVLIAISLLQDRAEALKDRDAIINVVEDVWPEDGSPSYPAVAFYSTSIHQVTRFAAKKKSYYLTILSRDLHWPLNEKDITQLIRQEVIR